MHTVTSPRHWLSLVLSGPLAEIEISPAYILARPVQKTPYSLLYPLVARETMIAKPLFSNGCYSSAYQMVGA